jgi:hypothetical protein
MTKPDEDAPGAPCPHPRGCKGQPQSAVEGTESAAHFVERVLRRLRRWEIINGRNGLNALRSDLTDGGLVLSIKLLAALELLDVGSST